MNNNSEKDANGRKEGRAAHKVFKAAGFTVDAASSIVSSVLKIFGSILLILLIAGLLFTCVFAYYVKSFLTPSMDLSLEDYQLSESSTIWYQNSSGDWQELVILAGAQKRIWVDYDDIPKYLEQALIAIEDKRFYQHKGVDWYRTSGAFIEMFARMETGYGGSTITQQLIKNLTGRDQVTIQRKLSEIFGALELEKKYDKQEILEWYLNAVYFGEGCYGVQAAAQTYFGKDVKDLTLAECASIVGITNKPTYYDPFYNEQNNKDRQETILREMYEQEYIDYDTYRAAVDEELNFTRTPGEEYTQQIYTYYEEVVINDVTKDLMELKGISRSAARTLLYNGGYQIYSLIDPSIQAAVDAVYEDYSAMPRTNSHQQFESAIVIMDPYDGSIKALSVGVGPKTQNFVLNRAVPMSVNGYDYGGAQRSPGSAIKPIASYGPAVNEGLITPTTVVNDSPYIRLRGTSWYPSNDGGGNYGIVTIAQALQYSLNTVAAQIVDKLGPETSYEYLTERLGVTSLVPDDASYAPMALGQLTNGISVRE
ncbi:MAG: transglycosylase domain-containing protein, partial [Oscillospiraceae bacterium]|nr:transglycosylase domain-containing protein [Oscillospiraceae bacterium]